MGLVRRYLILRQEWNGITYPGDTAPGFYDIPIELAEKLGLTEEVAKVEPAANSTTMAAPVDVGAMELVAKEMLNVSARQQIAVQTQEQELVPSQPIPQLIQGMPEVQHELSPAAPEIQAQVEEQEVTGMEEPVAAASDPEPIAEEQPAPESVFEMQPEPPPESIEADPPPAEPVEEPTAEPLPEDTQPSTMIP